MIAFYILIHFDIFDIFVKFVKCVKFIKLLSCKVMDFRVVTLGLSIYGYSPI